MAFDRPDGRSASELRPIKITRQVLKYAEGSCLFEMGDTKVLCSASLSLSVPPFLKDSGTGWLTAEYGMLPRSTKERKSRHAGGGRGDGRMLEIQRLIGRALRSICDLELFGERSLLIDCDVIQADGGTRTAAINGAYVAVADACQFLIKEKYLRRTILRDALASVSVGIVRGTPILDLCFEEDSQAVVDMNVVMAGSGHLVEIQGTGEGRPFTRSEFDTMFELAQKGITAVMAQQKQTLEGP
jgi:ribonuclease PH